MNQIDITRVYSNDIATLSNVRFNGKTICFGLEDPFKEDKVYGETRIPEGEYNIGVRTHGGFHGRYSRDQRFKKYHQGMLEILDVPEFKHILIHVGNSNLDTKGCLLLGMGFSFKTMKVSNSYDAYTKLYKLAIDSALNDDLIIKFYDED